MSDEPRNFGALRPAGSADTSLPLRGTVLLEEHNVFGVMQLYPGNELARALSHLTKTKTFTPITVEYIKALGLTVMTTGAAPRQL